MKKSRILAALLCVMMVLTTIPMFVLAEDATYSTIEDVVGFDLLAKKTFAFTDANAESLYLGSSNGVESAGATFDFENGLNLVATDEVPTPRWRIGSQNSSSLGKRNVIYFRLKVEAESSMNLYFHVPDTTADQDAYEVIITPEAVTQGRYSQGTQMSNFVPGTDFVEYLAVDREDGNGMFVYAKSADQYDGKWVCVLNLTTCNGSLSSTSEVYFSGVGFVQELVLYTRFDMYQTVEEVVGGDLWANRDYDFTAPDAASLYSGSGSGFDSGEVSFDGQSGMILSGSAPRWRFGSGNSSSLGADKAIYFRLKVEEGQLMTLYFHVPDTTADQDAYEVIITPEAVTQGLYSQGVQLSTFIPGTDFVEYLAVDREDGSGLLIYAKDDSQYDGKWVAVLNENVCNGNLSSSSEVYFTGNGAVQKVTTYSALDTFESIPEITGAAVYPYKSFNFNESYASAHYTGSSYDQLEVTYDSTGMVMADSNLEDSFGPRWRYYVADAWSAIAEGKSVYFKAKVNSAEEKLTIFFKQPNDETEKQEQAYKLIIEEKGLSSANIGDILIPFAPGTDFVEYLVTGSESGMSVYAKKDDFVEGKWVKVIHTTTTSGISKNSAIYFTGTGVVNRAMIYTPNAEEEEAPLIIPENEIYDSVQKIVGSEVISYKTFDMTNKDYQSGGGFVFKPAGEHTQENGAPIDSTLEGGRGFWRYYNGIANWSPLELGKRFVYFRLKVEEGQSIEVKTQSPDGNKMYGSFTISPDSFGKNNFSQLAYSREGGAGTEFVEYLMVAEEKERVRLYAKGLTDDGKWVLAAIGQGYGNKDNDSIGLYFAGSGYLKRVELYEPLDTSLLFEDIKAIAGEGLYPYKEFKFTLPNIEELLPAGNYDKAEITYDTENGLTLSGDAPRWRFADADGWSAIDEGRVVYFKAKVQNDIPMIAYFKQPNDETEKQEQVYVLNIAATGVTSDADAETKVGFAPGTDWAEYLVEKTETGMAVYARQDGFLSGKWVNILHTTATIGISKHSAVYFTKAGSVQQLTIYDTDMTFTTEDSLQDIAGNVAAAQYFDFKPGFDLTVGGGTYIVTAPTIEKDGMFFSQSADWRFYNVGGSKWSPLENGNTVVFKAKVSDYDDVLYSLMKPPAEADPEQKGKVYIEVKANGVMVNAGADVDMKFNFVPGTDWAEYLVRVNDNGGYNVWVKAESFGNNKWYLLAETTAYNYENGSGNTGLRFRCNDTCQAYLDYANVYTTEGVIAENATLPSGAGYKYFEETFDTADLLHNVNVDGMTTESGNLVVAEGKGEGTATLANLTIPKGGYAEFKTAGHNINALEFSDGNGSLLLSHNGIQASVGTSGDNYSITDGGNTYRTWRVVRNNDGTYNGYTMADGDGVWVKVFENKPSMEAMNPTQILLIAGNPNVKYDYIKVYGPAPTPEGELAIYDGFGTEPLVVTDGAAKISYYGALRMVVKKGATQKNLILAEVKDGLLTNLSIVPVEAGIGIMTHEYAMKDKNATLKVLLWNDFSNLTMADMGAQLTVK